MEQVLLIDDDIELCSMLQDYLARHGFKVTAEHHGELGLHRALKESFDIVLLDVMLPGIDGFEVLRRLRTSSQVSVLLLTARGEDIDRIVGLEIGADDYLPKPFDPDELMARIQAVLRRSAAGLQPGDSTLTAGKIRMDLGTREVWSAGSLVELTGMEFDLLELLMRSKGSVVSREEITALLFEREATPYDRFLDVHVSHLRTKLHGGRGLIRAVRGVGYVLHGKD